MDCDRDKFVDEMEIQKLLPSNKGSGYEENHSETFVEDDATKKVVALITVQLPTRRDPARQNISVGWGARVYNPSSFSYSKTSKEQLYSLTNLRDDPVSLCVVGVLQAEVDAVCSKHNFTGNSKRFQQIAWPLLMAAVLIVLACVWLMAAGVVLKELLVYPVLAIIFTLCFLVVILGEMAHQTSPEFQAAMRRFECDWQEFERNTARMLESCGYGFDVHEKPPLHSPMKGSSDKYFGTKIARMYGFEGKEESLLLHEEKKLLIYETKKGRNPKLPAPLEKNDMTELEQTETVQKFYGIKDMHNIQNNGILEYRKTVDPQVVGADHAKEEPQNNNDNLFAPLDLWTSAGLMFGRTLNLNGPFAVAFSFALVAFVLYIIGSLLVVALLFTRWVGLGIIVCILSPWVVLFVAFKVAFHFCGKPTLDRSNAELASVLSPLISDRHGDHTLRYENGKSVFVLEPPLDGSGELLRPIV